MIFFLLAWLNFIPHSYAEDAPATVASPAPAAATEGESEYEVDYEEEPTADEPVVEVPVNKPVKNKKPKNVEMQGSRAEKRFAPMFKSETKSFYKKNGRPLDVDTD